jgi:hypothetical protein
MAKTPPRISVTERGTQTSLAAIIDSDPRYKARLDNPFNEPSAPINLHDASRECRWFNAAIATDHVWRAKRKGWDQVRPGDVVDIEQIGGYNVSPEGYITRGERGQEVLMSMPKPVRQAVQAAKTQRNLDQLKNPNSAKTDLTNAAAAQLGPQAADYIQTHVNLNTYHERVERVEPTE